MTRITRLLSAALAGSFSAAALAADPANMALCPYSITVYATANEPEKVHVSYRRIWRPEGSAASRAALKEVDALLDSIAREAVGLKK